MQALAEHAVATFGRIDTWVHLAAVSVYAPFAETKPEEFKRLIDVNLLGQAYGAMAALPHLRREGSGALIHISSLEARRSLPLQSAYAASKHGMVGFLDSLRMELEQEGIPISVVNIMPGSINTPFFNKALTRLGVMPQPVPPVYEPELVADTILYAAEHPARELFVGGSAKSFGLMQRVSPRMAEKSAQKIGFSGQFSDRPKPANAPNNLFEHVQGYDTVHGDFGHMAMSSPYTRLQNSRMAKWGIALAGLATGAFIVTRVMRARRQTTPSSRIQRWLSDLRLPWNRRTTLLDRIQIQRLPIFQRRANHSPIRRFLQTTGESIGRIGEAVFTARSNKS
jgi:NAD(P)-dependent dehydrogenase (short-subunit alcohol dehydrogenase family)